MKPYNFFLILTSIFLFGCSSTSDVNDKTEMSLSIEEQTFNGLEPYAQELLDELRLLAKTRSAYANASKGVEQRKQERMLSTYVLPGFERKVDWSCECDVESVMKGVAELVGYGHDRVFTYGQRPPGGVWVNVKLNNKPINEVLRIIDAEKGAQVDILIDNKLKTIVIEYLETKV